MIRTEQLCKTYHTFSGDVFATNHVSLHIASNGLYMILGKSGCGKTTLLNILSGLDSFDNGQIFFNNEDIGCYQESKLDEYRNLKMGVIFQEFNLISELTVYDNLRLALEIQNWEGKDENKICFLIQETLKKVGLQGYEQRQIYELSGGERQRVAIARTLVKQPNIIFADEPTGNLDSKNATIVFELLQEVAREYVVIVVTPDRDSAYRYADTVIEMENGKVIKVEQNVKPQKEVVYSFVVQKNNTEPQQYKLSQAQAEVVFFNLVCNAEPKDAICFSAITKQKEELVQQENRQINVASNETKKVRKLPISYQVRLMATFLTKKKLILFLTVCILALSLSLLFGAFTTTFYQKDKTIIAYLREYQPDLLPINLEISYQDSFYRTQTETLTTGKYLSDLLENTLPLEAVKVEAIYGNDIYTMPKSDLERRFLGDVTVLFVPDGYKSFTCKEGQFPKNNNECMLTDYIAAELGVKVGDCITDLHQTFRVSGIVQTDYAIYDLKAKLLYGDDSPFVEHYMKYRYNVIYCRSQVLHNEMTKGKNRILLPMSDFTAWNKENAYRESELYYDNANKVKKENLVIGRLPQKDFEVLISQSFLENKNLYDDIKDFQPFHGKFANLNDEELNHALSMNLDLSDVFSQGVTVVGVVANFESQVLDADVYVHNNVWQRVSEMYFNHYAAALLYHVEPTEYTPFVQALTNSSIRMEEPALMQIYSFADILRTMDAFLIALLIITILLSGFMLTNFIQISIRGNRKNVGILRALGVPMKEVTHIFAAESWIVYLLSILLGIPMALGVQNIANRLYAEKLVENPYSIITWNWPVAVTVLVAGAVVCVIALQIPLRRLKRRKPIDLIR